MLWLLLFLFFLWLDHLQSFCPVTNLQFFLKVLVCLVLLYQRGCLRIQSFTIINQMRTSIDILLITIYLWSFILYNCFPLNLSLCLPSCTWYCILFSNIISSSFDPLFLLFLFLPFCLFSLLYLICPINPFYLLLFIFIIQHLCLKLFPQLLYLSLQFILFCL